MLSTKKWFGRLRWLKKRSLNRVLTAIIESKVASAT